MLKRSLKRLLDRLGWVVVHKENSVFSRADMEPEFLDLADLCRPFTMTSIERMYALYQATDHVLRANVAGDLVECGVWKGGSAMLMAHLLVRRGDDGRRIWLYDTYEGMSAPTGKDENIAGDAAAPRWEAARSAEGSDWCRSPLDEVRRNLLSTSLGADRLVFVKGRVEDTIPGEAPDAIALLRLDTDFYESTRHELVHLYPRLSRGGVLILDDYGHWKGAREATDRYFVDEGVRILLNRIDYTGRIGIKP